MGIVASLVVAGLVAAFNHKRDEVALTIASDRDHYGRCADREFFVLNKGSADALDIEIRFDVDYFTRQGAVTVEYGDEKEMFVTSAMKTLLARMPFVPVEHRMDYKESKLLIPRLRPNEYLHIFLGGETIVDAERAAARGRLLEKAERDLMDKPRISGAVRKDGDVTIYRTKRCL